MTDKITTADIRTKALELSEASMQKHEDNNPLVTRLRRAHALISDEIAPIIRIGFDSHGMRYLVPSRNHPATDLANETATGSPFYTVILTDIEGPNHHHICGCEDFLQAEREYRKPKSAWRIDRVAPRLNGKIYCKHILAAFAIQHARELLGLTWEIESTAYKVGAKKEEMRTSTDRDARAFDGNNILPKLEATAAEAKAAAAKQAQPATDKMPSLVKKNPFGVDAQRYYIEHPEEFASALIGA